MKTIKHIMLAVVLVSVLAAVLVFSASAEILTGGSADQGLTASLDTDTGIVTVTPHYEAVEGTTVANFNDYLCSAGGLITINKDIITEIHLVNGTGLDGVEITFTEWKGHFSDFPNLTTVTFPSTIKTMNQYYCNFKNNPNLKTWGPTGTAEGTCDISTVGAGAYGWGANSGYMFQGAAFTDIKFGGSIGNYMFDNCDSLTELNITTTGQFGKSPFSNCDNLKKVTLVASMTDKFYATQDGAFSDAVIYTTSGAIAYTKLSTVKNASGEPYTFVLDSGTYNNLVEYWYDPTQGAIIVQFMEGAGADGKMTLGGYNSAWESFINGTAVSKIIYQNREGGNAVKTLSGKWGGTNTATVVLPETLETLGWRASGYTIASTKLKTIGKPSNIKEGTLNFSGLTFESFGSNDYNAKHAFKNGVYDTIIYPDTATAIADNMFSGVTTLTRFVAGQANIGTIHANAFANVDMTKVTVVCVKDSVTEASFAALGVTNFEYVEKELVWTKDADDPNKYATDGDTIFITVLDGDDSGHLNMGTYSGQYNGVENNLKYDLKTYTKLVIVNNPKAAPITSMNCIAGKNESAITTIVVPDTLTTITGRSGGYGFNDLKHVTTFGREGTPEGVCDLTGIRLADNGDGTNFLGNANFTKIIIGAGQYSIQAGSFDACSNLTELYLPNELRQIYAPAFAGSTSADLQVYADGLRGYVTIADGSIPATATFHYVEIEDSASSTGMQVRTTGYAGVRGLFTVDLSQANAGYKLVEFGAVAGAASKFTSAASLYAGSEGAQAKVIWSETNGWEAPVVSYEEGVSATFAYTVTYTAEEITLYGGMDLYMRAYTKWQNEETGKSYTLYTDYESGDGTVGKAMSLATVATASYLLNPLGYDDAVCWAAVEAHRVTESAAVSGTNATWYLVDTGSEVVLVYRGKGTINFPAFKTYDRILMVGVGGDIAYNADMFSQAGVTAPIEVVNPQAVASATGWTGLYV